jgi:hypothetical protein
MGWGFFYAPNTKHKCCVILASGPFSVVSVLIFILQKLKRCFYGK